MRNVPSSFSLGVHGSGADSRALHPAASRLLADDHQPDPDTAGWARLRSLVRLRRSLVVWSVGILRHGRHVRRLSAHRNQLSLCADVDRDRRPGGGKVTGYLVGLIALRRTGIYFAMITVAIAEVFFFVEFNPLSDFTGGENGLPGVPTPSFNLGALPRCASTPTGRCMRFWRFGTSSAW